ncbi:MAG: penicillin-binding transpeptidase domain-containing protein [Clostridia bacterium]|nr:penicillin-binding transpeptidase domain-containing protein [Clostridia bacterium]
MRKILIILICTILFLVGCQKTDPIETVENYLTLWKNQKYQEMYQMLPSEVSSHISEQEFVSTYQEALSDIKLIDFEITDDEPIKEDGNTYLHVTAKFDAQDILQFQQEYAFPIVLEDREWKIDWDYNLIFPDLQQGDKVETVIGKAPERGTIYDSFDNILAVDGEAYTVGAVPEAIPDENQFAEELSSILELNKDYILEQLHQKWVKPDSFVPLRHLPLSISDEYKQDILSVEGVMLSQKQKTARNYPAEDLFSHAVGYVQTLTKEELEKRPQDDYISGDIAGKQGIESAMEETLSGQRGYSVVIKDKDGSQKQVITEKPESPGADIVLTLDSKLQSAVYQALANSKGSIVALHPNTGEVLAMVSNPPYDPNMFSVGMLPSIWKELSENPDNPLINRTIKALYPPGSTFKPFTAAAALEEGIISPDTIVKEAQNEEWKPSDAWGNHSVKRIPHPKGDVNLRNALVWSDNIYFAWTALQLKEDKFEKHLNDYGMEDALPFTLSVSKSQIKKDDTKWSEPLLADSGYGQGEVLTTPLQLAAMYTAFCNDGDMLLPQIVKEIRDPSGQEQKTFKTETWKQNAMSSDTADIILDYLIDVVEDPTGTGNKIKTPGLKIAAKTGTSQVGTDNKNQIAWLVAFTMDNENPLLLSIALEVPSGQGGSKFDIAKQIFQSYYQIQ